MLGNGGIVPIDHIAIDELHMMLRITDVLTSAIVQDAMLKDRLAGEKKPLAGPNLAALTSAIRQCGVISLYGRAAMQTGAAVANMNTQASWELISSKYCEGCHQR